MRNEISHSSIYHEVKDEMAFIYFNRPEKRNALNYEIWEAIPGIVGQCEKDPDVKIIIFMGVDESAFSAGADISEFKTHRYTAEDAAHYNELTMITEEAIMKTLKPTIAMIQGYCVGGGCEIALACDFRFSDPKGKFGITPAKLGLVYNTPGTKNLVDLIGPAKAKDILFTGRLLEAEEAFRIGLIDRIYDGPNILSETIAYAKQICKNAQLSVRGSKQIIREVQEGAIEDSEESAKLIIDSFVSKDYQEGVTAFLEKRKAHFTYS